MSALICLGAVQECVLVFLLVTAMLGVAVLFVGVAVRLVNFGGPGRVFCRFAGCVVGIDLFRHIWQHAVLPILDEIVAAYTCGNGKEYTVKGTN